MTMGPRPAPACDTARRATLQAAHGLNGSRAPAADLEYLAVADLEGNCVSSLDEVAFLSLCQGLQNLTLASAVHSEPQHPPTRPWPFRRPSASAAALAGREPRVAGGAVPAARVLGGEGAADTRRRARDRGRPGGAHCGVLGAGGA